MKYPKINTLWKRDKNNKFNIIEGSYSCKEFEDIDSWYVTEKIDGTNIRVYFENEKKTLKFMGRSDNSNIPSYLEAKLFYIFLRIDIKFLSKYKNIVFYGEGYGDKIQYVGSSYIKNDVDFILFDILADNVWLNKDEVKNIAEKLSIKVVPSLGVKTKKEIIDLVKGKPMSEISDIPLKSEGIVATSNPLSFFEDGSPIIFKLKVKDYEKLKNTDGN